MRQCLDRGHSWYCRKYKENGDGKGAIDVACAGDAGRYSAEVRSGISANSCSYGPDAADGLRCTANILGPVIDLTAKEGISEPRVRCRPSPASSDSSQSIMKAKLDDILRPLSVTYLTTRTLSRDGRSRRMKPRRFRPPECLAGVMADSHQRYYVPFRRSSSRGYQHKPRGRPADRPMPVPSVLLESRGGNLLRASFGDR